MNKHDTIHLNTMSEVSRVYRQFRKHSLCHIIFTWLITYNFSHICWHNIFLSFPLFLASLPFIVHPASPLYSVFIQGYQVTRVTKFSAFLLLFSVNKSNHFPPAFYYNVMLKLKLFHESEIIIQMDIYFLNLSRMPLQLHA